MDPVDNAVAAAAAVNHVTLVINSAAKIIGSQERKKEPMKRIGL